MWCGRRFACTTALVAVAYLAAPARAADPDLLLWLKLDAASGTLAADDSGNGNSGTVVTGSGTPEWVAGRKGNALEFDGLAEPRVRRLQVPWNGSLAVTNQLTAMSWIRLRVVEKGEQSIVGRSSNTDWRLLTKRTDKRISFVVDTTTNRTTLNGFVSGAGLTPGAWYHVAATYDGSRMRIYLNGIELANRACSGNIRISSNAAIPLGVGAFPKNATSWEDDFPGTLDEVRIWKRALTASEILTEMNAGNSVSRLQWRENF